MSNLSVAGAITYEAESSFGEDVDTTATWRLPIIAPVDLSGFVQKKHDPQRVQQYRNAGDIWINGTMEGSFTTKMYLTGHGSTTTGSVTITAMETFLGLVFGNAATTADGTTLTGGTANIPTTTSSGTLSPGEMAFVGALGDGDCGGQAYVVASHSTTNLTLLTDLDDAPANGAVLSGGTMIFPSSSPTATTITSCRFLLQTANLQVLAHGCFPTSVTIAGLNPGEQPTIEITWTAAWFEYKAETFPSAVSTDTSNPGSNAAGSLWINTVGTSTHATRTYRDISIEYTMGVETLRGPGGVNQYQDIVGCRRTTDSIKWTWEEDADAATTSPTLTGYGTGTNKKHAVLTLSTGDGSRVAMYSPCLVPANVPNQISNQNLNRSRIEMMAYTGATTTSALTLSPWRMLFA